MLPVKTPFGLFQQHRPVADIGQLDHHLGMNMELLLIAAALTLSACNAADTRAKRLAAIEEVEQACRLPKTAIDRRAANEPASKGRACDPVNNKCYEKRFIHLGNADFDPILLCRFSCIKIYKSKDGYNFGLYLHRLNTKQNLQIDGC